MPASRRNLLMPLRYRRRGRWWPQWHVELALAGLAGVIRKETVHRIGHDQSAGGTGRGLRPSNMSAALRQPAAELRMRRFGTAFHWPGVPGGVPINAASAELIGAGDPLGLTTQLLRLPPTAASRSRSSPSASSQPLPTRLSRSS